MGNTIDGSNDVDADGKYLLLSVPKFKQDPISGKEMTSYLRLGASSSTWPNDPGGDLAAQVNLAGPTGGGPTPNATPVSPVGDDPRPVFIDDVRVRDGFPGPHTLSVGDRIAQSDVLHTRGGWRDHSDGNRISTTYGDKIEIIRGNYKMVVLGRQDDESKSAGLDISGQHLQTFAYTNPSLLRISWTQDHDGVWHIEEASEGVVHSVNFAGDDYEFKWGKRFESTTGQPVPVDKDPATGACRLNPVIIEKTWAERIESYTGDAVFPIPLIQEETWAKIITSTTYADSTSETTTVTGAITASTTAASTDETTTVSGAITATTTAGTITETTTVGAQTGTTMAGSIVDTTIVGAQIGTTVAGAVVDTAIVGGNVSTFIGNDLSIMIGNKIDLFAGLGKVSIAASVLGMLDLALAATAITGIKVAPQIIDVTSTPLKVEVNNVAAKIEVTMGVETEVFQGEVTLGQLTQNIAAAHFMF